MKRVIRILTILILLLAGGCEQRQDNIVKETPTELVLDLELYCEPGVLVRPDSFHFDE
ncbi:MAG: hypothetical protein SPK76_00205 [Bacteroidales bacterium]|nr:hypothetical protein [Bacteroidales bacterium]